MEDDLKVKNVIEEREEEVYTVQVFISGIPLYLSQSSDLTQQINFFRLHSEYFFTVISVGESNKEIIQCS